MKNQCSILQIFILGDCQIRKYHFAQDVVYSARRIGGSIVGYVTADAMPQREQHTSKVVFSNLEITLAHFSLQYSLTVILQKSGELMSVSLGQHV